VGAGVLAGFVTCGIGAVQPATSANICTRPIMVIHNLVFFENIGDQSFNLIIVAWHSYPHVLIKHQGNCINNKLPE
jgi:hypothetical protein